MSASKKIPISKLKRSAITSVAAAKVGLKHAGFKTRALLMDEQKKQFFKQEHEENIGKLLFTVLSQLRGTALKVSQILSMEADILPESIRKQLRDACYQVPPINRALVRKQIVQELGNTPNELFRGFNSQAFAAASIGQVHRAKTFDDQLIAVKIQYPGIASTIESDLVIIERLIWTLSKTSSVLPHKEVLALMMQEMQERLAEEVNYEIEAKNLNWFQQNVNFDQIVIPKVIADLSSKRVLTLEMLEGFHLVDWLKTKPSQQQINQMGQLLFDFFWYSVFKLKKINADPHPGNFLFMKNNCLGVLDFGCVRELDNEFIQRFGEVIPALIEVFYNNGDSEKLRKVYQSLKIISMDIQQDEFESDILPYIKRFAFWFGEAYATETFDFRHKTSCPGKPDENSKKVVKFLSGMYQEQLCFDRAHLGLMNLLTEMGALIKTDWNKYYKKQP